MDALLQASLSAQAAPTLLDRIRGQFRVDNYGTPGPDGWSLTEILQLDDVERDPIVNALRGWTGAAFEVGARPPVRVKIVPLIEGFVVRRSKCVGVPTGPREFDPRRNQMTVRHHGRGQRQVVDILKADTLFECDLAADDAARSALWILMHHGFEARPGRSQKGRFVTMHERDPMTEHIRPLAPRDEWAYLEDAYAKRHPERDPRRAPTTKTKPREAAASA